MKLLDPDHPFFAAVWRRWLTALFPIAWGAVELWHRSPFWGVIFIAAGVYAFVVLILRPRSGGP